MTFNQDPASVAMNPAMRDPTATRMWWAVPAAGNPDIAAIVPAMIAVNPNESALGRWRAALNNWGRWANANHDLRE